MEKVCFMSMNTPLQLMTKRFYLFMRVDTYSRIQRMKNRRHEYPLSNEDETQKGSGEVRNTYHTVKKTCSIRTLDVEIYAHSTK